MIKFKFQIRNGYLAVGSDEIAIKDFIGEVEQPITPSMQMLIDAHGGLAVPAAKTKKRKTKKEVK